MPFATRAGCRLYYDRMGSPGAPRLVLVRGLARSGRYWGPVLPPLSERFELLVLDNRGVGRSGATRPPYTAALLADDVVAAMDHAGWDRAHVFGMSLGGMIAQRVALRHGHRVERLVLGCTTPGGKHAARAPLRSTLTLLRAAAIGGDRGVELLLPLLVSDASLVARPEIVAVWKRLGAEEPRSLAGTIGQLAAASRHDAYAELPRIDRETLVVTGADDALIPPRNSELLAARIPNARLTILPGARHDFTTDRPDAAARAITEFLLG